MRLCRANLVSHSAAAQDSGWPILEAISFDRAGSVSTDGFRLTFVPYPDGEAAADDPAVDLLVPIAALRPLTPLVAKLSVLSHIALERVAQNRWRITIRPHGESAETFVAEGPCVVSDKPFPKWGHIASARTHYKVAFSISAKFLRQALDQVAPSGTMAVTFRSSGPSKQVAIQAAAHPDGIQAFVIVMPISTSEAETVELPAPELAPA